MSSTGTSLGASSTGTPTGFGTSSGLGAGVYYAAIGVAVAIIASITLLSRILYTRKLKQMQRRRLEAERLAMDRRGEAPGLPTYHQSRLEGRQLDANTFEAGADDEPPPEEEQPTGWNHYIWSRLPTISLPAALHMRRDQPPEHELPAYTGAAPPKYEDTGTILPELPASTNAVESVTSTPGILSSHEMQQRDTTDATALPPPIAGLDVPVHVVGETEADEEFIHPEERRRRDAERAAGNV